MSHPLVAAVWEQLGRRDLANILREIVGEHAADLAVFQLQDGSQVSQIELLTRSIFWIKAIFDLQRTYMQGLRSMHDNHAGASPYLLPSEAIFSTTMYLVQVKTRLFPHTTPTPPEAIRYRHFLAHTLLTGVRLLLLHGEYLDTDMKFNMERTIRSAWQDPDLSNVERFLVSDLIPKAINSIGSPELCKDKSASALGKAYPASIASGTNPFSGTSETQITDLLTAIIGNKTDKLVAFFHLFDMLWATESALIQCHIDRRRFSHEQGQNSSPALQVEETYEQAREIRMRLARTILAAFDDEFNTPSLQILATIILGQNVEGHPPLQTRRIRDTWAQLSRFRETGENSLGYLVRWLINRRVQLWDCNGELEAVSHDYQQHLARWLQNSPLPEPGNQSQMKGRWSNVIYVVNCPAVHLIPRALLEEQLHNGDRDAYEELQENPRFLTTNISCPLCPGKTRIQYARMIESQGQIPVNNLSGSDHSRHYSLPGSISRNTTSSSSTSHSTGQSSNDVMRSPASPVSYSTGASEIIGSYSTAAYPDISDVQSMRTKTDQPLEKPKTKSLSRDLKSVKMPFSSGGPLFRRVSSVKENQLPHQPRFCFSATGSGLLFWGADTNWLLRIELPLKEGQRPVGHKYDVSGVQYAASGDRRCAVIAAVGEHYELLIFERNGVIPEACLTIESQHSSLPIICIAMSRDDKYVAFTLKEEVRVYEISKNSIKRVSISGLREKAPNAPFERKLQFSVDGRSLVVATPGYQDAYVDTWNCSNGRWNVAPDDTRSFKLPSWTTNNKGLPCVFRDSFQRGVLLTAFFKKEHSASFSVAEENKMSDHSNTRVIHAAQSPSGSRFVIANGMGQIYLCDTSVNGTLIPSKAKKASAKISDSVFKPRKMVVGFPREDEVNLFWVKQGRLMLRMLRTFDGNENVLDYDLRADVERLLTERPPASGSGSSSHYRRLSLLSNQPIAEMDGSTLIPGRPDMAELEST